MVTSYLLKSAHYNSTSGIMQIQSDVGNLSCNPSFLSDKNIRNFLIRKLCQEMLDAFQTISKSEGCKEYL